MPRPAKGRGQPLLARQTDRDPVIRQYQDQLRTDIDDRHTGQNPAVHVRAR